MQHILWISLLMLVSFSRLCPAADKINFAYSALSGLQAPLWVAKEAGFFKKHDIDAQLLFIVGGR
jgi:ABC-type nitrate/sulfonate/bicarbonate transport system substrate-binding protein